MTASAARVSVATVRIPGPTGPATEPAARILRMRSSICSEAPGWAIGDLAGMHGLPGAGLNAIMTARPEVWRDVYSARGLWLS
ncbi:hypothetical protein Ate01nite_00960 [Actinoplanes teichomyceticus]|nr:hypothetical protein Ate01nite_00960 [Actinoplanes teichomyceticus]